MGWGVHDYPEPPEEPMPVCPECGEECDTLYLTSMRALSKDSTDALYILAWRDIYESR